MLEPTNVTRKVESAGSREPDRRPADDPIVLRQQLAARSRQLEASERQLMETMETAQRQSEVLALYAHDLRSPLSAIIGYADLLEMGVPEAIPDCAQECVSRIREAAVQLQVMLDQLLAEPGREARLAGAGTWPGQALPRDLERPAG